MDEYLTSAIQKFFDGFVEWVSEFCCGIEFDMLIMHIPIL